MVCSPQQRRSALGGIWRFRDNKETLTPKAKKGRIWRCSTLKSQGSRREVESKTGSVKFIVKKWIHFQQRDRWASSDGPSKLESLEKISKNVARPLQRSNWQGVGNKYPSGYRDLEDPKSCQMCPSNPAPGGSCLGQAIPRSWEKLLDWFADWRCHSDLIDSGLCQVEEKEIQLSSCHLERSLPTVTFQYVEEMGCPLPVTLDPGEQQSKTGTVLKIFLAGADVVTKHVTHSKGNYRLQK